MLPTTRSVAVDPAPPNLNAFKANADVGRALGAGLQRSWEDPLTDNWEHGQRWRSRSWAARLTRALVFLVPIVVAVLAAIGMARALPEPTTVLPTIGWWIAVVGTSLAVSQLVARLASRLLPLAALLNMSLVFPDRAPSRFRIALRSGSSGRLRKEVARARAAGADDDPTRSAEFALTLIASLGKHDHTTRGHAERTRAYADLLAEEMNLDPADRERLRWAALLHDIGKVKVDAAILQKDSPLDNSEWDVVRRHPTLGFELIAPIREFLGPWAETVLHHHERFDGRGYPLGVAGEDIAMGARIVAVADAYDAMTALRSYQDAVPRKAALAELTRSAGSQFDPSVVRAFLQLSTGAIRGAMGPLAVLAQLPFVGGVRRLVDSGALILAALLAFVVPVAAGLAPGGDGAGSDSIVAEAGGAGGAAGLNAGIAGGTGNGAAGAGAATGPESGGDSAPTSTSSVPQADTTTPITTAPPIDTTTTVPSTFVPITSVPTTTVPTTTVPVTSTTLGPRPPTVVDDLVSTSEDTPTIVDVVGNDSDPNGDLDPSSLLVGPAAHGSVTLVAGAGPIGPLVSYVPDQDFHGADLFDYEVCDLTMRCVTGLVSVTVSAVNDLPDAADDLVTSAPRTPIDIDVLGNDSDVDLDALTIDSADAVSARGGIVTCVATCYYSPPAVWAGNDTFSYTVSDGQGGLDTALVTVTPAAPDTQWFLKAAAPGDTAASSGLPLTSEAGPANTTLPNFDTDRDSAPGLWLGRSGAGLAQQLAETDPTKFQLWSLDVVEDLPLLGDGVVSLHAAMESMTAGVDGRVRVFLLDCPPTTVDGTDCAEIGNATVTRRPWSDTPDVWVAADAALGVIDYTLVTGRALVIKLVVAGGSSGADMWFAFDSVDLLSALTIRVTPPAPDSAPPAIQ